jgi:lysozyme family protein
MSDKFKLALEYLFKNEGDSYVDNPSDSGGPTKYGVTQKSYSAFVGRFVSDEEMKNLTPENVFQFYEKEYWRPLWGERINECSIIVALFDTAVLYGAHTAIKLTQKTINQCGLSVSVDGFMGEITLELLNKMEKQEFLLEFYSKVRSRINEVCAINPKDEIFKRGWQDRANLLLTLADDPKFNLKT